MNTYKLSFCHFMIWVRFLFVHLTAHFDFFNDLLYFFIFLWFLTIFIIDFDGYFIIRTDEGQPRPKYIFKNVELISTLFTLQRFGPSPSPNFRICIYCLKFGCLQDNDWFIDSRVLKLVQYWPQTLIYIRQFEPCRFMNQFKSEKIGNCVSRLVNVNVFGTKQIFFWLR